MLFLLLLTGCDLMGQGCNLMFAPSALAVSFEVASEGVWDWTVSGEGLDDACSVTLPDGTDAACEGGRSMPRVEGGDGAWVIGATTFEGGQEEVRVVLSLDGVVMLDETVTPEWSVDEPNGKGCGERYTYDRTWTVE